MNQIKHRYKNNLYVGNQEAEKDANFLETEFVSISTASFVGSKSPSIFLGRKGSGKSALRLHFEKEHGQHERVVSISPGAREFEVVFDVISRISSNGLIVEPISRIWEIAVVSKLLISIIKDSTQQEKRNILSELPRTFISLLKEGENLSIAEAARFFENFRKKNGNIISLIRKASKNISDSAAFKNRFHFVLIDSVDEAIHNLADTSKRNDLFSTFFEGLIVYFRDFLDPFRNPLAENAFMKLFIPVDIYEWAVGRHDDRIRQYKHYIKWDRPHLEEFIVRRLEHNLERRDIISLNNINSRENRNHAIWSAFFPEHISGKVHAQGRTYNVWLKTKDVLIGYTLYRPRDLQELIRLIEQERFSSGLSFPNAGTIKKGIEKYSEALDISVRNEYRSAYPQIDDIMARLAGSNAILTNNQINRIVEDVVGLNDSDIYRSLKILYEAGVIGVYDGRIDESAGEINQHSKYYYDFANFNAVWNSRYFAIHPGFWYGRRIAPVGLILD